MKIKITIDLENNFKEHPLKKYEIVRFYDYDTESEMLLNGGSYYVYMGEYKNNYVFQRLRYDQQHIDFSLNNHYLDQINLRTFDVDCVKCIIVEDYGLYRPLKIKIRRKT